jgi:transcriptional regulator with XRE-family HTH domain
MATDYAPGSFVTLTRDELRALRDSLHCRQQDIALALGIDPNTYARMERGELSVTTPMARLLLYVVADQTHRPVNELCAEVYSRRLERSAAERRKKKKRKTRAA